MAAVEEAFFEWRMLLTPWTLFSSDGVFDVVTAADDAKVTTVAR
jgi:hypothetical protein